MPREKIGDDVMQVRFPDGTFSRIDAIASNRSEWIRDVVLSVLMMGDAAGAVVSKLKEITGDDAPATPEIVKRAVQMPDDPASGETACDLVRPGEAIPIPRKGRDGQKVDIADLRPDAVVLLGALRKKPMGSRDAEKAMGWLGLRYSKAEKQLIGLGLVRQENGILVAEGEG